MRGRGDESRTVSFRLAGKALAELERQAKAFGISAGELSRALVERELRNETAREILGAIDTLNRRHAALAQGLEEALSGLEEELAALRKDFNRALQEAP